MSKRFRHGQILKIIRAQPVFTQEALSSELRKHGIIATQVTLSRDLRELGLVKTPEGYRELAADPAQSDLSSLFTEFVSDVRIAQNILVLKTDPGHASPVAVALDAEDWPEIVGTVAGDDTILVVTADCQSAEDLRTRLLTLIA